MSQRYWLAALAFGIAAAFWLLPPHYGWADSQKDKQGIEIKIPFPPLRFVYGPEDAKETEQPCKPEEDNRNSDLCAQWKAADAAKESAYWTKWTFFLGVFGSIIGGATFAAAFAAARYAKRAAIATEKTIDETRRIGEAQVRAYVSWHSTIINRGFSHDDLPMGEKKITGFRFIPKIQNTGQSPALMVSLCSLPWIGAPDDIPTGTFSLAYAASETFVGAGNELSLIGHFISMDDAIGAYKGEKRFCILGYFAYRDVFQPKDSEPHVSSFCLQPFFEADPANIRPDTDLYANITALSVGLYDIRPET